LQQSLKAHMKQQQECQCDIPLQSEFRVQRFSGTVGEVLAHSVCYFSYDVWVYNFGPPDICVVR